MILLSADPMFGIMLGVVAVGMVAGVVIGVICLIFGIDLDDKDTPEKAAKRQAEMLTRYSAKRSKERMDEKRAEKYR